MKTASNKKKVPLPQIKILDYVPYTIVPPGETNLVLPFLNPNPAREGPFEPCKEPVKNKAPGVKKEERTNSSRGSRRILKDGSCQGKGCNE